MNSLSDLMFSIISLDSEKESNDNAIPLTNETMLPGEASSLVYPNPARKDPAAG